MYDATRAYGMTFFLPHGDTGVGHALRSHGEFARPELDLIVAYLRQLGRGALVDVGANIGAIALPAARLCPGHRVLAIEPNRRLAMLLSGAVIANGFSNVEVFPFGLDQDRCIRSFMTPTLGSQGNFGELSFERSDTAAPAEDVLVTTLDDIAPSDTRLVKIDVEGAEAAVLAGARKTLALRSAVFIIEANARLEAKARIAIKIMLDFGYRVFSTVSPHVTPAAPKGVGAADTLSIDHNVLCLPPSAPLLVNAPEITTPEDPWIRGFNRHPYLKTTGIRVL